MNKCINPQHGLGNMDLHLHTGVHLSLAEKSEDRKTTFPHHRFEFQRSPRTPTPCYALSPHAPSAQLLHLWISPQRFLCKYCQPLQKQVQVLPLLLILLDHPSGCQQHAIIVRTTGTSTEDLLWLQVGMREDELLLGPCFTYSLTKFSLAT